MKVRGLLLAVLFSVLAPGSPSPATAAPAPWTPKGPPPAADSAAMGKPAVRWVNDQPDTGQFLPDTVLLARVAKREIRVGDYVDAFFKSYAEFRPKPDSAGRVEFLNSMINKDVLGLTALEINRPMGFEDRAKMREHTQRVYSNVLYQRAVLDSALVTEEEARKVYEQHRYAQHLRHIHCADRATAEKLRADLVAKRITWKDAVRKYSLAPDREKDGDLGWASRFGFDPIMAAVVWPLKPGEISPVVVDAEGYQLIQAVERRPDNPPAYQDVRMTIRSEVQSVKVTQRADALQAQVARGIGMVRDTANMVWASSHFRPTRTSSQEGSTMALEINADLPEFTETDTARVLARHRYGTYTLGAFLQTYNGIQPMLRPNVNDFDSMRSFVDGVVLEPYMAELALQRGLDKDSMAVAHIEARREELLVEHMYQDSILSKVWIRPEDRRKYYNANLPGYFTFPRVTFAAFVRPTRAGADSLMARLRAGEKAADILRADSVVGHVTGSIQERSARDEGMAYHKILFEELRPGQAIVQGPDRQGEYAVIQLLTFDPGRQLPYEEVEHYIDESLQNLQAEERLKAFIERHRKRYRIEARYDLLPRVRLVDPTLLE